jgi:hypothetical protein
VGEARLPMPKGMAYKDLLLFTQHCCTAHVQSGTAAALQQQKASMMRHGSVQFCKNF